MTTFDKVLIGLGAAATALNGYATLSGGLPKWLVLTCIGVQAASFAIAPSLRKPKDAGPVFPEAKS